MISMTAERFDSVYLALLVCHGHRSAMFRIVSSAAEIVRYFSQLKRLSF